jgi:purine-binding chemotaxis protein CheW
MEQNNVVQTEKQVKAKEGKYLTFVLENEEYGIEIIKIREIIGIMDITTVPNTPEFIKGVINLRGKVIPVIDLRLKFGMEEAEYTSETCIIVVEVKGTLFGAAVDTVSEVADITAKQIEPTPSFGGSIDTDYILGMAKIKENVKILLDIEMIISNEELSELQKF